MVCSLILSGAQCGHSGDETSSEKEMKQSDESDEQTESAEQAAQASNEMDSKDDDMNQSARERVNDPEVDDKTLAALVEGNSTFGFELYQKLRNRSEQNVFYSPYNLSTVLAMLYAGAEGKTAKQMKKTLGFELADGTLHPAFNHLDQSLHAAATSEGGSGKLKPDQLESGKKRSSDSQETSKGKDDPEKGNALQTANTLWSQKDYSIKSSYLDVLGAHYGSSVKTVDFQDAAGESVQRINDWVSESTNDHIEELVSESAINDRTRLVLTAAIYLRAKWKSTFDQEQTEEADFQTLDGETRQVDMMHQKLRNGYRYAEGEMYEAVELPYRGNELSMVVLVPDKDSFEAVEKRLDAKLTSSLFDSLASQAVDLKLPKFEFDTQFSASSMLQDLGMKRAFSNSADFGKISEEKPPLTVSDVVHKARITVDETGTEAAAASGVTMEATGMRMDEPDYRKVTVDRPFVFMIRHRKTDTVLFAGRVLELGE